VDQPVKRPGEKKDAAQIRAGERARRRLTIQTAQQRDKSDPGQRPDIGFREGQNKACRRQNTASFSGGERKIFVLTKVQMQVLIAKPID